MTTTQLSALINAIHAHPCSIRADSYYGNRTWRMTDAHGYLVAAFSIEDKKVLRLVWYGTRQQYSEIAMHLAAMKIPEPDWTQTGFPTFVPGNAAWSYGSGRLVIPLQWIAARIVEASKT